MKSWNSSKKNYGNALKYDLVFHASNVTGIGARTVVASLLHALANECSLKSNKIQVRLPDTEFWNSNAPSADNWDIFFHRRSRSFIGRVFQRTSECLFHHQWMTSVKQLVVLGDIPLRFKSFQLLLVHNPHLVPPPIPAKIDKFAFLRLVFRLNLRFVDKCIVQTDTLLKMLQSSYPELSHKIVSIPMPVSDLPLVSKNYKIKHMDDQFTLFYPASAYLHKNHKIISCIKKIEKKCSPINLRFILTLSEKEFYKVMPYEKTIEKSVKLLGTISKAEVYDIYLQSQALFFPSLEETYGLPLLEAMNMGLIIICSDLPYARWMCEDEAIYFDPNNADAAFMAIKIAIEKYNEGWKPDWRKPLAKIPVDWCTYAPLFTKQIPTILNVE